MSEQLAQATMEQPQQAGFMNRIYDAAREHPIIAKLAVGVGMLGAGGAAELATADSAAAQPTAEMSSDAWTVLGGDPLVPGGVHSRSEFVHVITSGKGQTAMKYAGLGSKERQAVTLATREGDERSCSMPYGETFPRMSFGINGTSVDRNVTFADPDYVNHPAAAFCVDAKVDFNKDGKTDEVIHIKMPEKCGNVALVGRTPVNHPKPHHPHPKHHHPKHGSVSVLKIAEDDQGHHIPTPTGTFQFDAKCKVGEDMVDSRQIYNHDPQTLLRMCNVGSVATVRELAPLGGETWKTLSPQVQKQIVRKGGNRFVFKDQEVPPTQPTCEELGTCNIPNTPALPPFINILEKPPQFEGMDEQDQFEFCANDGSNPASDGVTVTWDAKYGTMSPDFKVGNEDCSWYTAPNTPETDENVTATATDKVNGQTATDQTGNFPIRQPQ